MGEALGMHDHGHVEFHGFLPHRVEAPVVKVGAVHVGADLKAVHREVTPDLGHHLHRQVGVLHGQVAHRREPVRVLCHHLGKAFVLKA